MEKQHAVPLFGADPESGKGGMVQRLAQRAQQRRKSKHRLARRALSGQLQLVQRSVFLRPDADCERRAAKRRFVFIAAGLRANLPAFRHSGHQQCLLLSPAKLYRHGAKARVKNVDPVQARPQLAPLVERGGIASV